MTKHTKRADCTLTFFFVCRPFYSVCPKRVDGTFTFFFVSRPFHGVCPNQSCLWEDPFGRPSGDPIMWYSVNVISKPHLALVHITQFKNALSIFSPQKTNHGFTFSAAAQWQGGPFKDSFETCGSWHQNAGRVIIVIITFSIIVSLHIIIIIIIITIIVIIIIIILVQGKNIPPGITNLKTAAGEQISASRDKFIQVLKENILGLIFMLSVNISSNLSQLFQIKSKAGSAFIVLFDVIASNGVLHAVDTVF